MKTSMTAFSDPKDIICFYTLTELIFTFVASSTEFTECMLGNVRLTNFTDDSEEGSREGILQICINNAWGTVCSDNYFDTTDAEVFCKNLLGFNAMG